MQYIVCYNGTGEKRVQKCICFFCLAVFACIAPQDFYAEPPKPPYGGGGSESLPPLFGNCIQIKENLILGRILLFFKYPFKCVLNRL